MSTHARKKGFTMTGGLSHIVSEHPYFGVFVFFIVAAVAFPATLVLTRFISRKLAKLDREKLKLSIYECGPEVTKQPNSISVQFYLIALLFILFDVEIIFMIPWGIDFKLFKALGLGWFGLIEMMLFVFLLSLGFIYAWKKGALEWHNIK
jgi:NADH-quinone oxidoreductase subunit A